jgi:hypothetical protein
MLVTSLWRYFLACIHAALIYAQVDELVFLKQCVDAFYGQNTKALVRANHKRTKKAKMLPREVRPSWQGG